MNITPSGMRDLIAEGKWTCVVYRPPEPPPEWSGWRRQRMEVAIRCAWLFVVQRKAWQDVMSKVGRDGLLQNKQVTRQRINQLVTKGFSFLMDRGVFQNVGEL